MKKFRLSLIASLVIIILSTGNIYAQAPAEFGLTTGGFTNFPANQDYLKRNIKALYIAPYVRTGNHEFSAGISVPLRAHSLWYDNEYINPSIGARASYKFYFFKLDERENLFIHYTFQYLRLAVDFENELGDEIYKIHETDSYINNTIGIGYNLYFDSKKRFSLYYTLDYIISQAGYRLGQAGNNDLWTMHYIWNNLSTHVGLSFKLVSLDKKEKK